MSFFSIKNERFLCLEKLDNKNLKINYKRNKKIQTKILFMI